MMVYVGGQTRWEFSEYQDRVRITVDGQREIDLQKGKAAKKTEVRSEGTVRGLLLRRRERSPPDTCIEG